MSLYDFDTDQLGSELLPPELRQPKHLAWLKTLFRPTIQWIRDSLFNVYFGGQSYAIYAPFAVYNRGDRVLGYNKSIYQCLVNGTTSGLSGPYDDPAWMKTQDIFIGVDERVKYNSQIIVLEYALNHYFLIPDTDPQIYLTTNSTATNFFVMGNSGATSSPMPNNSAFSQNYLANTPSFTPFLGNFTVYFPDAVFSTLGGNNATDNENIVRGFVDKYCLAGLTYNVIPYI